MIKIQMCIFNLGFENNYPIIFFEITKKDIERFSKNDETSKKSINHNKQKIIMSGKVKNNILKLTFSKLKKVKLFLIIDIKSIKYNKTIKLTKKHPLHGEKSGVLVEDASFVILTK